MVIQSLSLDERKKILLDIADALEANEKLIKIENEADMVAAQQAGYEKSLMSRLTLMPGKISSLSKSIRILANMEEPIGSVLKIASLAVRSGNGLLLKGGIEAMSKGGIEAMRSNAILCYYWSHPKYCW